MTLRCIKKIHGTLIKLDCQRTCLCVLKEDVKGLWPDLTANNKPNKNKIFHTSASSSLCAGSSDCGVCLISLFGSLYILTQWGIISCRATVALLCWLLALGTMLITIQLIRKSGFVCFLTAWVVWYDWEFTVHLDLFGFGNKV